ncbi:hypothetical protein [Mycolicibacterium sp. 018/SC-01/001]|uniref:DUF7257 domain-containing protein n=1 Tax=Mycolicibacterium sp. 018/SC-01/001 TaxID=2592069 RepID=UPI00117F8FDB|nr:hypothetical protein [Mycolicibacterium sp. 018/SC-01/001]
MELAGVMRQVFKIQDLIEALSGVEDGDTADFGTAWANHRAEVRASVDNLVTGLFGWIGTGFDNDDQAQAIQDVAATIAGLSASVTALQNSRNNQSVGGLGTVVDFTSMPTGSLPSTFTLGYTGSAGTLQVANGVGAYWSSSGNSNRTCNFTFNDLETATDYQKIWLAFGSSPEWRNSSTYAVNEIHGRKNAAGDTYVFASMSKYTAQIGCVVGGARTVFVTKSTGFSFKSNGLYALECGTVGGLRTYRLLEGSTVVLAHTEAGTTSQLGAGYRLSGGSVTAAGIPLGQLSPGTIAAFALSDNQATTLVGSFARMYRSSTTAVGISSGYNQLPANFFDNAGGNTEDLSYDLATGGWTVANDGNYWVKIQSGMTGITAPDQLVWTVFINGVPYEECGNPTQRGSSEVGGVRIPTSTGASTVVPLQAGDTVTWGYWSNEALVTFLNGEASGKKTHFSIGLLNRSLA